MPLYEVRQIHIESNNRDYRNTNRLKVAEIFFESFLERSGPIVEKGDIQPDGTRWVATETHIVEIAIVLHDNEPT